MKLMAHTKKLCFFKHYIQFCPSGIIYSLAFVPDQVQVIDVAFVTLVKADLVLRPVVLELPVRWRGDNKMHRPVSKKVHLSAVAVDYGVMALQGTLKCHQ